VLINTCHTNKSIKTGGSRVLVMNYVHFLHDLLLVLCAFMEVVGTSATWANSALPWVVWRPVAPNHCWLVPKCIRRVATWNPLALLGEGGFLLYNTCPTATMLQWSGIDGLPSPVVLFWFLVDIDWITWGYFRFLLLIESYNRHIFFLKINLLHMKGTGKEPDKCIIYFDD